MCHSQRADLFCSKRCRPAGVITHMYSLMQVARLVDALEARIVSAAPPPSVLSARLAALHDKLALLEAQLSSSNVKGLRHTVDALCAAVDLQASVAAAAEPSAAGVDARALSDAADLLAEQNKGIAALQGHVHKVERDIKMVQESAKGPDTLLITSQR
jgi:hypothetical protein